MKEICIPVPGFREGQVAELELSVTGKKEKYFFRVEAFPWKIENESKNKEELVALKIAKLQENLANYDQNWELIQIYTPSENAEYIQVLFRKKKGEI